MGPLRLFGAGAAGPQACMASPPSPSKKMAGHPKAPRLGASCPDNRTSRPDGHPKGSGPRTGPKIQHKGKQGGGRGRGKDPKA